MRTRARGHNGGEKSLTSLTTLTTIVGFAVTITKEPDGLFWVKVFSQDGLLVYRTFQSEHEARNRRTM